IVLDRGLSINLDGLSKDSEGERHWSLRTTRQLIGVAKAGSDNLEILLDHVQTQDQESVWLFSGETLLGVPDMAEELQASWLERLLPKILLEKTLLSLPLFRWLGVLIIIPLALIISWVLARPAVHAIHKLV